MSCNQVTLPQIVKVQAKHILPYISNLPYGVTPPFNDAKKYSIPTTRKITFPPKQYKVYRTLHPHPSLLNPSPRSLQAPTPPIAQRETTKRITCLTPDWGRGEEGDGGNSPKPANESQKVNIIKSKTQKTDCPAITQP